MLSDMEQWAESIGFIKKTNKHIEKEYWWHPEIGYMNRTQLSFMYEQLKSAIRRLKV